MNCRLRNLILFFTLASLCGANSFARTNEKKIAKYLKNKNFVWKKYESNNFIYYVEKDSFQENNIEFLKEKMEAIHRQTLLFAEMPGYPKKPFIFLMDSREKIKMLVGFEANGLVKPDREAVFMIYNRRINAVSPHELFHLYSWNVWGKPKLDFISEGMAVYADDMWHLLPLHPLAKHLKDEGKLLSLAELTRKFTNQDSEIFYPQAGSFVKFLSKKYGKEKIRKIWRKNVKDFTKIYGKQLKVLEKEWLDFLDRQDTGEIKFSDKK